jgi:hypothetical protein
MQRTPFFIGIAFYILSVGCRRNDSIETYRVSKEPFPSNLSAPASPSPQHPELTWRTPTGWKEQPASAMRIGSFLITGTNGQTADVSVIPLSGPAGGDLANINRWRGQINLPPISMKALAQASERVELAGRKMTWIDFSNDNKRVMAAIYKRGDRTWFFKAIGDDQTVREAKPAFLRFLKSLTFHAHP